MDKLDQVEKLIGIKFGKSTSHNYKKAVQIANQFSDFMPLSEKNESNCIWIDLQEFREKYKQIESLWYIIRGWKSSELYLEGTLADYNDLRLLFWAMECATAYSSAIVQDDHCKFSMEEAGWGCKKLKEIFLGRPGWQFYYRNRKFWFQFGHFETPTRWKVDKDDIRKALSREANFKKLFVCPVFDFEKANEIIDSLPDEIDLESSDSWEIIYQENLQHQSIEKKPICIAPKNIENHSRDGLSASISFNLDSDAEKEKSPKIRFIPDVCFEDIGGIDDILQIIREIIELPMKQPRLFDHLKIEPHKGILLHGPAGCGKTLIAKAIANEVKAHFIPVKGPELLSKWHGQSEQNLRSIFEEARELQPSVIRRGARSSRQI
jgi:transitional endoplasmic reticulum ATPase